MIVLKRGYYISVCFLVLAAKVVFGSGSLFGRFLSLPHISSGGRLLPPPLSLLQVMFKAFHLIL